MMIETTNIPELVSLVTARSLAKNHGFASLITLPDGNAKLGADTRYFNAGITLAQGNLSGHEVCHGRGACFQFGDMNPCLGNWGRSEGDTGRILNSRIGRTKCLFEAPEDFDRILRAELLKVDRMAERRNVPVAFRPNVLSDYPWHRSRFSWIFEAFPEWQFYGYTKIRSTYSSFLRGELPENYHLTFSYSENVPDDYLIDLLQRGGTVAVPFATKSVRGFPARFLGFPVCEGVSSDLRFLDDGGTVIGLTAKAPRAKAARAAFLDVVTRSGFFVSPTDSRCSGAYLC
jgi:hypothetical protein